MLGVQQAFHPLHLQIKLPALLLRLGAPGGSLSAATGALSGSGKLNLPTFLTCLGGGGCSSRKFKHGKSRLMGVWPLSGLSSRAYHSRPVNLAGPSACMQPSSQGRQAKFSSQRHACSHEHEIRERRIKTHSYVYAVKLTQHKNLRIYFRKN
jgi:hypothetical protein